MKRRILLPGLLAALGAGCTVGPNYKRPAVAIPATFRAPEPLPPAQAASFADLKWFEVFKDDKLQDLIRTALAAELRSARRGRPRGSGPGQSGDHAVEPISRISAPAAASKSIASRATARRRCRRRFCPRRIATFGAAALELLSFEIDIWGRLRRATEAARANLLSAEENRKAVVTTLVSDVATAYLTLRELDYELEISRRLCRRARNRWS